MEITSIAVIVSAAATAMIAIYAWKSHELAKAIKSGEDEFRQQISDLYRAIVISNLIVSGRMYGTTDFHRGLETFIGMFDMVRKGQRLFEPDDFKNLKLPRI